MSEKTYPLMHELEQELVSRPLADIEPAVRREFARWEGWDGLPAGGNIAVTAGSRGISNIPSILRAICDELSRRGFKPFVVCAMGSHGGATVQGQLAVLSGLGITPESVGAPVRCGLEVDEIGRTGSGDAVVIDRLANRADGLIVVGRVKKHTDFFGPIESGLMKMIAIGLGKHDQAAHIHSFGAEGLRTLIPEYAQVVLQKSNLLFGLAILEDGLHQTSDLVWVPSEEMARQEPLLLRKAAEQMARIPVQEIDLLIVERMGKDISGAGMDTNVIGRYGIQGVPDPPSPRVRFLVVLDLTDASHGNAIGVGLADMTTERLFRKIDWPVFYMNASTSGFLERGKIPLVCPTDQAAIDLALRLLAPTRPEQARVVQIKDTHNLSRLWVSAALANALSGKSGLSRTGAQHSLTFTAEGTLLPQKE